MSEPKKPLEIFISPKGSARHVYSPEAAKITETLGAATTRRASHVEPTEELRLVARAHLVAQGITPRPGQWWADMICAGTLTVLGPFAVREEALAAETVWLSEYGIPQEYGTDKPTET